MEIIQHNEGKTAEVRSDEQLVQTTDDGLDLMGTLYYQGYESIVLPEKVLSAAFFDLRTGMAGELLQKFSNYRIRLAIVGDFSKYESKSLHQFILESNKGKQVCFVETVQEALDRLAL